MISDWYSFLSFRNQNKPELSETHFFFEGLGGWMFACRKIVASPKELTAATPEKQCEDCIDKIIEGKFKQEEIKTPRRLAKLYGHYLYFGNWMQFHIDFYLFPTFRFHINTHESWKGCFSWDIHIGPFYISFSRNGEPRYYFSRQREIYLRVINQANKLLDGWIKLNRDKIGNISDTEIQNKWESLFDFVAKEIGFTGYYTIIR